MSPNVHCWDNLRGHCNLGGQSEVSPNVQRCCAVLQVRGNLDVQVRLKEVVKSAVKNTKTYLKLVPIQSVQSTGRSRYC